MAGITDILGIGAPGLGLSSFSRLGAGSTSLLADTANWAARVTANGGSVTAAQISAVDTLARRIVTSGLRSQVTRMNPMVGNAATIVVPYWSDWGPALDTLAGAPTIDANGMTVTGTTQWLSTGVIPSSQTGWDSSNSHLGVHVVYGNPVGADASLAGCWSNGGTLRYAMRYTDGVSSILAWLGTSSSTITRNSRTLGILSGHRMIAALAGTCAYYEEGISVGTMTDASNSKPTTAITIGNATGSALAGDFIIGGYHLGGSLTSAQSLVLGEAWHQFTQTVNRQRSMLCTGDSLTASGTWHTLYRTNFSPKSQIAYSATGGIGSAQILTNLIADIAATPAIKWYNTHIWCGQNDSGTSYGATTIANTLAIMGQIPHTKIRVTAMIYKNVANEFTGQSVRAQKDTVTTYFATNYPTKAINYTTTLQAAGGTAAAGTVAQDARDVANGVEPSSYHLDTTTTNITAITKATNAQVTATAHGAITGDTVYISGTVVGMTEIQGIYDTVTVIDANNFTMDHTNSTAFTTYTSGGSVTIKDAVHFNPSAGTLIAAALNTSTSTWSW